MKRLLCISLMMSLLLVFGCQSEPQETPILDDIKTVSVSESQGYGGNHDDYFMTLKDQEVIQRFETVMTQAKRVDGKAHDYKEMPDYDILIQYDDGGTHLLQLLIGNEGEESVFVYVGHEDKVFLVTAEWTTELRQLILLVEEYLH